MKIPRHGAQFLPRTLEFDNAKTEKAPAPLAVWLILPAFWLLWRFKIKTT